MNRRVFEIAAQRATLKIGEEFGDRFPMYFVAGYPRSGTTWVSQMLADYLQVPFPQHYLLPILGSAVIHSHANPDVRVGNAFYIVRDGRDVMVSYYFYVIRKMKMGKNRMSARFRPVLEQSDTIESARKQLPVFIKSIFKKPRGTGTKLNWSDYNIGWHKRILNPESGIIRLKYEDLLEEPVQAFRIALDQRFGYVDMDRLRDSVKKYSMRRQKEKPSIDQGTYLRKGTAGDWKNYFTKTAAELFDHYAGEALVLLGYEKDRKWVENL